VQPAETPTEKTLVALWARLLHLDEDRIGANDDFFELGGHSILAVHLMNQIRQEFPVDLRLRKIFDHPTVRQLGALIDGAVGAGAPAAVATETKVAEEKEYYICSPAQERLFYEQWLHRDTLAYNVFGCFEVSGGLDAEKVRHCFQQLVDRHEGLRTSFHLLNGHVYQKVHSGVPVQFHFYDEGVWGDPVDACRAFLRPFDLEERSLFRCRLVRIADTDWLLTDIHHIVCDGLSMNILMNEFRRLYEGRQLAPLSTRYVDFAEEQKRNLAVLDKQKAYWSHQLASGWPSLNLSVNQPDEGVAQYPAGVVRLEIAGSEYRMVKRLLAETNVSGFMFLLSLYYILLSRMSGNTDILVASDSVGRTQAEWKDVVGTFINLLPLRATVKPEESYRNFLNRVRQIVLDAFENQDYPFDEMLSLVRAATGIQKPDIEAHFAFAGYIDADGGFQGLQFKPLKVLETTQYGFKVEASEQDGRFVLLFIYSKAFYTEEIITLLARYYQNILRAVLEDKWVRLGDIELQPEFSMAEQ
jgi:acyl carrier protein